MKSCSLPKHDVLNIIIYLDRQRQAERKQQELEREAERKRKHMGGSTSVVQFLAFFGYRNFLLYVFFII